MIDWGSGQWYHSGPWGAFTTKSVSFDGAGVTLRAFGFLTPRRLVSLRAYNGGPGATTVTLRCAGQADAVAGVAPAQVATIVTGWTAGCTTVTVGSSNGWHTNFDDLVHDDPAPDPTAPVISGVVATAQGATGATVSWTTDEAATSQVEYGPTAAYGAQTALDGALVTQHGQALLGLTPDTAYHFRVLSRDGAGNETRSPDGGFRTGPALRDRRHRGRVVGGPQLAPGGGARHPAADRGGPALGRVGAAHQPGPGLAPGRRGVHPRAGRVGALLRRPRRAGRRADPGRRGPHREQRRDHGRLRSSTRRSGRGRGWRTCTWPAGTPAPRRSPTAGCWSSAARVVPGVWADTPEVYDPATDAWTLLTGVDTSDLHDPEYPLAYLLPDGRVLLYGATGGQTRVLDVDGRTWTNAGTAPIAGGSAAMVRPGRLLVSGGGVRGQQAAEARTAVLEAGAGPPVWRETAPMAFQRFNHTLVLLPDGTTLAVGGSALLSQTSRTGPLAAELWRPGTETWTTVAAMQHPRMYHSTALLLPDGRVLAAGGGRLGSAIDYPTAELYSPPYLFKGPRPVVTGVAGATPYGGSLTIETPDAAAVASVVLVRLASVTHTLDLDQRRIELPFAAGGGGVVAQGPSDPRLAPPGPYMLFLVTAEGVPSVARTVLVGAAPVAPTPTATPTATATAGAATATRTATAAAAPSTSPTPSPTPTATPEPTGGSIKDVGIADFRYEPPQVTVAAGDSVRWTNTSPATVHSATGAGGEWDSGLLSAGQGFTAVFPSPGVYPYRVHHPSLHDGRGGSAGAGRHADPHRDADPPADHHAHGHGDSHGQRHADATRTATATPTPKGGGDGDAHAHGDPHPDPHADAARRRRRCPPGRRR